MRHTIVTTRQFRKAIKKLKKDKKAVSELGKVTDLLLEDKMIPPKYRDHKLNRRLKDFRELHLKPDLLLIYKKQKDLLVLLLAKLGSHDDVF